MAGRGAFGSRIGFTLAAIGSAVGIGNLWRFPYLVSTEGGAAFILVYLALLFLIGLPALMAELSLGRRTRLNAFDAFRDGGRTKGWSFVGVIALATAVLLLAYYSVIAGWGLRYLLASFTGEWSSDPGAFFDDINEGVGAMWMHLAFMAITVGILLRGVSAGIERANLIMMPLLFLTILGLALYGNLQAGADAGRDFYLRPDLDALTGNGWRATAGTVSAAAGQTFFSIGLGLGTMLTYSSYMRRDNNLQATGLTIGFADTGVALLAGLMVFPLLFSLGLSDLVNPDNAASAGGLFIVLPTAFAHIGGVLGSALAIAFFVMLAFAAITSAISILEVPISALVDRFPQWGRQRAVLLMGIAVYIVGLPTAMSLTWLGHYDTLVSNVLLLLGGLLLVVYVGWVRRDILDELTVGAAGGLDLSRYWVPVIRFVLPALLTALLLLGIDQFVHDTWG
jgi:NSS family neurotransmitter:Na+ symporter